MERHSALDLVPSGGCPRSYTKSRCTCAAAPGVQSRQPFQEVRARRITFTMVIVRKALLTLTNHTCELTGR